MRPDFTLDQEIARLHEVYALKEEPIHVLDDGFVRLVDCLGSDASLAKTARRTIDPKKQRSTDRDLIRYLIRHRHTTPIEFGILTFQLRMPIDVMRQHVRHRMSSMNEYSTRYSEAIDSMHATAPDAWRLQSTTNRQGSAGYFGEWTPELLEIVNPGMSREKERQWIEAYPTPGHFFTDTESTAQNISRNTYNRRVAAGVALEQARKDLPLSTYTEAYWTIDLHNLLHYLSLRMDSHAQLEIRQYANAFASFVERLFPIAWQAFLDYRFNAVTLTVIDQQVIAAIYAEKSAACPLTPDQLLNRMVVNKRERDECRAKLERLGILPVERLEITP